MTLAVGVAPACGDAPANGENAAARRAFGGCEPGGAQAQVSATRTESVRTSGFIVTAWRHWHKPPRHGRASAGLERSLRASGARGAATEGASGPRGAATEGATTKQSARCGRWPATKASLVFVRPPVAAAQRGAATAAANDGHNGRPRWALWPPWAHEGCFARRGAAIKGPTTFVAAAVAGRPPGAAALRAQPTSERGRPPGSRPLETPTAGDAVDDELRRGRLATGRRRAAAKPLRVARQPRRRCSRCTAADVGCSIEPEAGPGTQRHAGSGEHLV